MNTSNSDCANTKSVTQYLGSTIHKYTVLLIIIYQFITIVLFLSTYCLLIAELMEGVEMLKELLFEMIPDDEVWSMVEEMIDELVEDRQNGRL